ncbi:MAG: TIGR04255 family protein [Actinomycetota bacterium]
MPSREVYPNAPLRLVTTEFRFPLSPVLAGANALHVVAGALGKMLPVIERVPQSVQVVLGPEGPPALPTVDGGGYRLMTRDRTVAVTVTSARLAVEITSYRHWETFRDEMIRPVLGAVGEDLQAIAGLDRIGLRYIDEIRVPDEALSIERWVPYINDNLLAGRHLAGKRPIKTIQGALHLVTGEDQELLMRFGALEGHVVDDSGPLRLPTPVEDGPFFLIDIDSFWTRSGVVEEFAVDRALAVADRLHEPVGELFEQSITELLRDEVLRRSQ